MRCIIIDDDPDMLPLVAALLASQGHEVDNASGLAELEREPARLDVDLVVLDYRLGPVTGIDVIRLLLMRRFAPSVVLLSAAGHESVAGAVAYGRSCGIPMLGALEKPLDAQVLLRIVAQLQASLQAVASEDIGEAMASGSFLLAYQPKLCLTTGQVMGVEALARWQNAQGRTVPPDRFIAVAEQDGQITPLTWLLIEQALAQQMRWRRSGICLNMAINLSPAVLDSYDFFAQFQRRLDAHGVAPTWLTLELTETRGIRDMARTIEQLKRLRALGCHIAIDDFGTGNASMLQLYQLPFTQLKIDKTFVSDCTTYDKAASIVRTVIELANRLGLDVVAEGVETHEQGRLLLAMGCNTAQGYFYSRPLYAEHFSAWYHDTVVARLIEEAPAWTIISPSLQQRW